MAYSQFELLRQRRFAPFFVVQSLGAFNDNVYRQAIIGMLFWMGVPAEQRTLYTNLAPALFILPYFLFSATAGQIAEKLEKARLIRITTAMEIVIMSVAAVGFLLQSMPLLLVALFGTGVQSTLFGPVKYSILPSVLKPEELTGGNGLVEMGTSMSILLGMIAGGLVFVVAGLAFKVSAVPFHMWTPDVYEGAPTPVVAFFAGAPKLAAMLLFARVLAEAFPLAADQWRQVLILIALASVAVGAFAGLAQTNLKRLWAYSSIANVGYAVLGLAAGTAQGVQAMLVFMALYTVAVIGFFACLAALSRNGRPLETLDDMAGLFQQRPWLSLALTVFALSGLGLPPFAGFWGKYYVFMAAVNAGDPILLWSAVAALVGSVIAAFYYLRLVKVMWFDPAPGETDRPPVEAGAIAVGAAAFTFPVVLGLMPLIDHYANAAAAALGLG